MNINQIMIAALITSTSATFTAQNNRAAQDAQRQAEQVRKEAQERVRISQAQFAYQPQPISLSTQLQMSPGNSMQTFFNNQSIQRK